MGGTHRFHDAAAVEAKHRISLKSHGTKIRVRTDTQTENDLLSVTQEELIYDALVDLLKKPSPTTTEVVTDDTTATSSKISVTKLITTLTQVYGRIRDHLVHKEVLVSWGELVDKCVHCFPSVGQHVHNSETTWQIGQHCLHDTDGTRYHYWGTDTAYNHASRNGSRRRRDMVHVSLNGEHLAEIVCFVRVILPALPTSCGDTSARPEVNPKTL